MRGLDAAFSSHALQSIADIVCTQRSSGSPVFYRVREGDETSCVAIVFKPARRNHTIAHFDPYYNDSVSVVVPFSCNCCTIPVELRRLSWAWVMSGRITYSFKIAHPDGQAMMDGRKVGIYRHGSESGMPAFRT